MLLQRRLVGLALQAPWHLAGVVLLGLAAVACAVGQGILVAGVVADVLQGALARSLVAPALAISALVVLRAVLLWARDAAAVSVGGVIKRRLRAKLYARLLSLGPGHLVGERAGTVQATLVDGVEALQGYLGLYVPQAVVAVVAPLLIASGIIALDPVVGAVVLAGVLTVPVTRPLWRRLLGERGLRHWAAYGALNARFLEAFQGLPTLKAFQASARYGRQLAEEAARLYRATVAQLAASLGHTSVVGLAMSGGTALAVAVGALRLAGGALGPGELLVVLFLAREAFRPLEELQNYWHEGFLGLSAAAGIFALLDAQPTVREGVSTSSRRVEYPALKVNFSTHQQEVDTPRGGAPSVAFDGVTFTYPGAVTPALQGVDLHIAPGETVALVGPSGAGKTTVAALLLRFFDPTEGRVLIDGIDARDLPLTRLRALIAVVAQDTYLFHGTVAENLRLARPDASDDELVAAARVANADEFVRNLPDGYATVLGERGATLSGGERQRLAIARAVLKDAPILVLDEATSSLDGANEAAIQEALARLAVGRTMLVIAHRLSTVAGADRVVVLERGKVVETGPPGALLERRGAFAALTAAQLEGLSA